MPQFRFPSPLHLWLVSSQILAATPTIMAQIEKAPHMGENPLVLSPNANKSVAKLLKENPYVAGVAVVSAIWSSCAG